MKNESDTSNEKTVQDILDELQKKSNGGGYIYRGENKCHPSVSSSLYREFDINDDNFDIELVEKEMLSDAKKHIGKLRQDSPSNFTNNSKNIDDPIDIEDLECLTELQHYGGKTNFIDFTTDYLIALFFACDGKPEEHGRVILQKSEKIEDREDQIYLPQNPRLRVVAQKSIFVRPRRGFFCPDKEKEVVCIEKHLKQRVLSYLRNYHGISTHTIYNDLHGFIKHQDRHGDIHTHFYRGMACQNRADQATSPNDKNREYQNAIGHYTKVIELNPGNVEAYYNRGEAHLNVNKIPEAIQDFSEIITLDPDNAEAYYSRGSTYLKIKEPSEAIQDFSKIITLDTGNGEAYYSRSKAYLSMEEWEKAKVDLITSKNMGVDIVTRFHSNEGSLEVFDEAETEVPEDISELLELWDTEEE